MTKDEALKLALAALEQGLDEHWMKTNPLGYDAITAIKQALEAPLAPAEQLAKLGWQAIECPFCGSSGAQAFAKPAPPVQEPKNDRLDFWALFDENQRLRAELKFNTTPPAAQRPWVGLTDEELDETEIEGGKSYRRWASRIRGQMLMPQDSLQWHVSRAIEAKLKEKNHD